MSIQNCFIVCILIFILQTPDSLGQYYHLYGDKTFGGDQDEQSGNIFKNSAGSIFLGGNSRTNFNGDKTDSLCTLSAINTTDLWILKIDTSFNILWQNDIGGNNTEHIFNGVYNEITNSIFFASISGSDSSCDIYEWPYWVEDAWCGGIDSSGFLSWNKMIGGYGIEQGSIMTILENNNLLLACRSTSPIGGDKSVSNYGIWDYWLIKTDSLGNKIWDNVYGGVETVLADQKYFDVITIENSKILLAGNISGPAGGLVTDSSRGERDAWIVKIDSSGNVLWQKRFGGNEFDYISNALEIGNKYLLSGYTNSDQTGEVSQQGFGGFDFWVVNMDTSGNIIWNKRYGGNGDDFALDATKSLDNGYWIAGTTKSSISGVVTESPYGSEDYWVIKIDSVGNLVWQKRFGGPGKNSLTSFIQLADSSIMLFGYADTGITSVKSDYGKGWKDYWLVHFRYSDSTTLVSEINSPIEFSFSPNPVKDILNVNSIDCFDCTITLLDISGRTINSFYFSNNIKIDLSSYLSGIYFFEISNEKRPSAIRKVVKL